jgi:hypothetical protein
VSFPPPTAEDLARESLNYSLRRVARLLDLMENPQNPHASAVELVWLEDACHRLAADAEMLALVGPPFPEPTTSRLYLVGVRGSIDVQLSILEGALFSPGDDAKPWLYCAQDFLEDSRRVVVEYMREFPTPLVAVN